MIFQPDTILQDRYKVLALLGKGGFSETYTVDDRGTTKVLKVLLEQYPKAVHLFQREAKVLSELSHPGIPSVDEEGYFTIDHASSNQPLHCLVMELIPGVDLRKWLGDRHQQPVSNEQAIDWLQQITTILGTIHQYNCFHRDIKPSNIMLRPNGQLALIDFGAVREVTETYLQKCADDITRTHVYSRGYTPIEQMQGRAVPESDFFALGRTFVHLMTGENPLEFSTHAHTGQLLWRDHAPQISPALADLIDCLMAPFPGQRPKTTDDIQIALTEIQANPALDGQTEGTVLSQLLTQNKIMAPTPSEAIQMIGTLPLEDSRFPTDETVPPSDWSVAELPAGSSKTLPYAPSAIARWLQPLQRFAGWPLVLACSVLATGGIAGLRTSGVLQPVELSAFDLLLTARPTEEPDDRILMITVDEDDLRFQSEAGMVRQGSLADEALVQLLDLITPHEPRVIGLDIYREATAIGNAASENPTSESPASENPASESPAPENAASESPAPENAAASEDSTVTNVSSVSSNLASQEYLKNYSNLIVVCAVGGGDRNYSAIAPPSSVPLEQVGFSDVPLDPDNRIRRQIIGMTPADHCPTSVSLSFQLATQYLAEESVMTDDGVLIVGDRPIPSLANHTGGYHQDGLGGYEVVLNYRQTDSIAETISLQELLSGERTDELADLVGDRIVLIGTTAQSFGDYHTTPLGEMAGVRIQAHMASQLVSAVLDQRPLIWAWPMWGDVLWVLGWSGLSGAIAWWGRSRYRVIGLTLGLAGVVIGVSYGLLLIGGWMPLVPSLMAIGLTSLGGRSLKS
ncbi:MAG: CHASE2 domain-containing protein, partial [Leptolyngbyaceae bacterium]|nr:CHASE2 domain-containing protein [Leptolyngbyaceae bacterium]